MRLTKVHYTVLDAVYRQGRAILYRVLTKKAIEKVFPNVNLRRETFNRLIVSFDSAKIQGPSCSANPISLINLKNLDITS